MRAVFKGQTFRLVRPVKSEEHLICNEIRHMTHLGSIDKHELGCCTTPQVYTDKFTLYAAVVRESNFINEIWIMREYDLVEIRVSPL